MAAPGYFRLCSIGLKQSVIFGSILGHTLQNDLVSGTTISYGFAYKNR